MLHADYIFDTDENGTKKEQIIYCGIVAGGVYILVLSLYIHILVLSLVYPLFYATPLRLHKYISPKRSETV